MELRLPKPEETQVSIVMEEGKEPIVLDLLELDDLHGDSESLASKMGKSFYESFSALFQEKFGYPLTRTQIYLLLKYKEQKIAELKKNCLTSLTPSSSTEFQLD